MRRATVSRILCDHMLQINSKKPQLNQVRGLLFQFYLYPKKLLTFSSHADASHPSSSVDRITQTQTKLSSFDCSGIAKSVLFRYSGLFAKKENCYVNASLTDLLLDISDVLPGITRQFRRFRVLKPEHVREILLGVELQCGKVAITARKVEILWEMFRWASRQDRGFKHLQESCEVMAWMLIHVGMLREVELLLVQMESCGILLDNQEVFSNMIKGYIGVGDVERALLVFDRMNRQWLVPSFSCYQAFIEFLVQMKRTSLAFRVCLDRVSIGMKLNDVEMATVENVIRQLCVEGLIQQARNLVRKVMALGSEPSGSVVNEISCGYCEKNDFEDLLSFFIEMKHPVDLVVGNKIIHTLCSKLDVERADLFMQKLEHLGFRPDEVTFGILIGWSCHEGNVKRAFIYLSEILSRGLKPDICSYNALIGGLFREKIWEHACKVLDEMVDNGTTPNLSTFKILLAGFCKARRFEEVKMVVHEMVKFGFIELSSLQDPLSEAFIILGFNPCAVRLKRDNDAGLSRTEFFDDLGNGLYLDTDLDEYDKRVNVLLESSMLPDFNLLATRECGHGNLRTALKLVDNMVQWGQELSFSVFSLLVKGLCASRSKINASTSLLERWPKLANQLDQETLNFLVQEYCKKGLTHQGMLVFRGMLQRDLGVSSETYNALIKGLCTKGTLKDLLSFFRIARNDKWLPVLDDCKALWQCLCRQEMLKEALELLESMLVYRPHLRFEVCHLFIESLCITGYSRMAYVLVEELLKQGCFLGHSVYSHLMKGFCNEKNFPGAYTILENMLAKNMVPSLNVSVLLIPQLCKAGKSEKAVALREISLKEQPVDSIFLHSALIEGFCLTGKLAEAENLFQDMLSNGHLPDADVHNMLVKGHCQANNWRRVLQILGVMVRKNINLSISSYRNLVRMMCMNGRFNDALSLKEYILGQDGSSSLVIYNILIFYLLSARNSVLVNRALDELEQKGLILDEVTYNFLVYGFYLCKDTQSSMHYLSRMISKGFRPNSRSLRAAISSLCGLGELDKALELSREMEVKGWPHGSVIQNKIVEGLISHGKLDEAEHFLGRMEDKGLIPDSIYYDNLIKRFCCHGRLNKAVDLLNIMLKKGQSPVSSSYDSIIHGFCTCNKLDEAMNFHTEMLDRDLKPSLNTWNMLLHKLCKEGQNTEAERLLITMVRLGENPTREMYATVIDRHHFEKNHRKALELMQLMQQSGYEPDFETQWSLISNLSSSSDKDNSNNNSQGFLSKLLSGSGFACKKDSRSELQ